MRTPWQSFRLDLERAPVRLWAALGRLEAFGETLAQLPAAPGLAASLTQRWRDRAAGGLFDAECRGAGGLDPEVAAVAAALYDRIDRRADRGRDPGAGGRDALTPQILCADNAALTEIAGAARLLGTQAETDATEPTGAGSLAEQFANQFADAHAGGPGAWTRLNQLCAWLNGPEFRAAPGEGVQTAVLRALGAHLFLLRLAPFRHCNEGTARLAGYRLLRASGLPAMAAHLPAAHFAATAARYAELIAEASEPGGATFAFVAYAVDGIAGGLRDQIAAFGRAQQANLWRDRVADAFDGRSRTGDRRRRLLVEALGAADGPVRIGRLRYLTPKLAEAYAGKSAKTLSRDVKWLETEGLVRRTLKGVRVLRDGADEAKAA